jgi:hypothetical protein
MNYPVQLPSQHWPDLTHVVTEDDTPVDNLFSEKEMRLLIAPLYLSKDRSFRVMSNVGLFNRRLVPIVSDVMLGVGVRSPDDLMIKGHRSWFIHIVGRAPDAAVEIVSNREGAKTPRSSSTTRLWA